MLLEVGPVRTCIDGRRRSRLRKRGVGSWRVGMTVLPYVGGANSLPPSPLSEAAAQYNPEPPVSRPGQEGPSRPRPVGRIVFPIPVGTSPAIRMCFLKAAGLGPGPQPRICPERPSLCSRHVPTTPTLRPMRVKRSGSSGGFSSSWLVT